MAAERARRRDAEVGASGQRPPGLKNERLNIRASRAEKAVLEEAANLSHMGVSRFMLQAALQSAEEVLADQSRFVVPTDRWQDFVALLDRPARVIPALSDAASKPSPFTDR
jgi:uncharacterized protein (DUF1778 family)